MAVLRRSFSRFVLVLLLGLSGSLAWAFDPFTVRDIRVVGIQRVDAGTVFGYLPVRIGETLTAEAASRAVRTCILNTSYAAAEPLGLSAGER